MNNDTEKGYLKISVTEAGGTIPIKGALVVITEYGDDDGESGNVLYSLTTDDGGYTPTVALDAPVKSESMMPGAYQPYSLLPCRERRSSGFRGGHFHSAHQSSAAERKGKHSGS